MQRHPRLIRLTLASIPSTAVIVMATSALAQQPLAPPLLPDRTAMDVATILTNAPGTVAPGTHCLGRESDLRRRITISARSDPASR
jgi:hypothetical protein